MASEQRGARYRVGIDAWDRMIAELLLVAVEHCGGDLARAAQSMGIGDAAMRTVVRKARALGRPKFHSLATIAVEPDRWDVMVARMLLAVVNEAPSLVAAAAVLGLRRSVLRARLRRARTFLQRVDARAGDPR